MEITCSTHRGGDKFIQNFIQKTLREKSLGRPRRKSEDWANIKKDLTEVGYEGLDQCFLKGKQREH
jgi:hypothetical protein